jgi:molybdate transport system substrate-binding protein
MTKTIKLVTTVAMQGAIAVLTDEFTKGTGYGIEMEFGPPSAVVDMMRQGMAADVVISTPEGIASLAKEGTVDGASAKPVARMIMGLAVGLNDPKPDITTVDGFKRALLDTKSIIYADPATGSPSAAHFIKVLDKLGIAADMQKKTTTRAGVVAVAVASGECAMAVQQLAELKLVEGVHVLGPFPDALQNIMPLSAAIHTGSSAKEGAAALIALLASPRAKPVMEKAGLLAAV